MIVVADTTPLLHLARIGRLGIVPAVVDGVTVPRVVWSELGTAPLSASARRGLMEADWIEVLEDPPLIDLGLDRGETAAILLAERLHADAILIDERRGRTVAIQRGIAVIGTLGILVAARRVGALDRVRPVIEELRRTGFWASDRLVDTVLASVGESQPNAR